ncbi:MAG: pilin [Nanoarchaeota archaeon]
MKVQKIATILIISLIFLIQIASAQFNNTLTPGEQQTFNRILEPVIRIYNLVKYAATFIAVIMLVFAGVSYITSGSNPGKRESSKSTIMYVFIGLAIIWAAPLFVQFIVN